MFSLLLFLTLSPILSTRATSALTPSAIAAQHYLASSTSLSFPTATLASAAGVDYLSSSSNWQITNKGHIAQPDHISFVDDPFANSTTPDNTDNAGPVMAILYPQNSYANGTGGTEFTTYFNSSSATGFGSMLLSYDVAFDEGFDFVKGGKLPGLRGGSASGCSGGDKSTACFSSRFMWRRAGAGEAYEYIQTPSNICSQKSVICNADGFGTSLGRGSFTFETGAWNNVAMYVALNNPANTPNGQVTLYYNGVQAIQFNDLQIRSNASITGFTGLFFSTFFGGDDASWSSPTNQSSYFRNIQMWGSESYSSVTKEAALSSATAVAAPWTLAVGLASILVISAGLLSL